MLTQQQFAVTERDSISSIVGIALVCEDISKGQKLVFRYPPERKGFALSGACGDTSNRAGRRRVCRLLAQVESSDTIIAVSIKFCCFLCSK